MELSPYQLDMLEAVVTVSPKIILRKFKEDCCIAATRILIEVLKKFHFKDLKPLTVEANIFNEVYLKKGRLPQSDEEAQTWLTEGAWQIVLGDRELQLPNKWPGHLVVILNNKHMIDLSLFQANRPHKNINMEPLCAIVPEGFVKGEDHCSLIFKNCLMTYISFPQDNTYQKAKDWCDKSRTDDVVKDIYAEAKARLSKKKS